MSFGVCQVDLALSNPLQLFFCLCSLYYFPHWDWSSSFTLDLVFNIAYAFGMEFSCFGLMNAYVWLMIGLCCISFLVVEFFRLWLCFSFSFRIRSGYTPATSNKECHLPLQCDSIVVSFSSFIYLDVEYLLRSIYAPWFSLDGVCLTRFFVSFWKGPCKLPSVLKMLLYWRMVLE
jgi:hypothetical protein